MQDSTTPARPLTMASMTAATRGTPRRERVVRTAAVASTLLAMCAVPTVAGAATGGATVLDVPGVVTVGGTSAEEGSASSTGVSVLGTEVTGSKASGSQESSGSIASTSQAGVPADVAEVAVGETSASSSPTDSSAASRTVRASAGGTSGGSIVVGESTATSSGTSGTGSSTLVGIRDGDGNWRLRLLAADATSSSAGAAALEAGDTRVLDDQQTGGQFCPLDLDPLATLDLVCASVADGRGDAAVLTGTLLGQGPGTLVSASGTGGPASPPPPPTCLEDGTCPPAPCEEDGTCPPAPCEEDGTCPPECQGDNCGTPPLPPVPPVGCPDGSTDPDCNLVIASVLPTTGGPLALLGLAGLVSAAGGGLVLTSGRRRRRFG